MPVLGASRSAAAADPRHWLTRVCLTQGYDWDAYLDTLPPGEADGMLVHNVNIAQVIHAWSRPDEAPIASRARSLITS